VNSSSFSRNAWAESLGLNRIGRDDNFFSLGGHSLAALKIAFKTQTGNSMWISRSRCLFSIPYSEEQARKTGRDDGGAGGCRLAGEFDGRGHRKQREFVDQPREI